MFFSLVSIAFAITIPVKATYTEHVDPGAQALASAATTATVALTNPSTGATFTVAAHELTANKRQAKGKGGLRFHADPAGSIRTWAVYFLAADGAVLGDPEVVTVRFDAEGSASIAARDGGGRTLDFYTGPGFTSSSVPVILKVNVQDSGADATLVGITELTNTDSGSGLFTDADMDVLDADTFAAFQEIGLDAVVALDTFKLQLEGQIDVTGLSVSTAGVVEGGADLRWDIGYFTGEQVCSRTGCVPVAATLASYLSPVADVKKKSGQPPRVALSDDDLTYDSWDAGALLSFRGDVRDLEIAASLDAWGADALVTGSDVILLDPGIFETMVCECGPDGDSGECAPCDDDDDLIVDIFQDGDCEDCGDFDFVDPTDPPGWVFLADELVEVAVYDSGAGLVSAHTCTLAPTAKTIGGTRSKAVLVGECTRDVAGTVVRRLRATIDSDGAVEFSLELAGPALAARRDGGCGARVGCAETTVLGGHVEMTVGGLPVLDGKMFVTETGFPLPFAFADDVDGLDLAFSAFPSDPAHPYMRWSIADDTLYGTDGDARIYAIDTEQISLVSTGSYRLRGNIQVKLVSPTGNEATITSN